MTILFRILVIFAMLTIYTIWVRNQAYTDGYNEGWKDKRLERAGKPHGKGKKDREEHIF